jgi:hypothetical protein
MNFRTLFASTLTLASVFAAGCGSTSEPVREPSGDRIGTNPSELRYKSPCDANACKDLPIPEIGCASGEPVPVCAPARNGSCRWNITCPGASGGGGSSGGGSGGPGSGTSTDPEGSVSFRICEASECRGPKPDAACPPDRKTGESVCGSENDAPCSWITSCYALPSTEKCPNPRGCGDAKPELAVVCPDGSTRELACMKSGNSCSWQPDCS